MEGPEYRKEDSKAYGNKKLSVEQCFEGSKDFQAELQPANLSVKEVMEASL